MRVRVVEYWIETGRECFNIGNFNSLMAIIAGLNMSPISRLKKTWSKIQPEKFAILEHQMDPSSNFNSYRSTLKAAMWRSAEQLISVKGSSFHFSVYSSKICTFLIRVVQAEVSLPLLPNGHINFEKFWQLAKQVTEFMAWKQVTSLASFECEPPDNNQEKRGVRI
ncbi:hypothetical protein NQ317_009696 [Molorchus minor]|uniref:Ras-GEF domain-containing protein n=1 Tax=Molorchus minor TaxID=1323400 RepID=A0ABQ9JH97_9CUCU|nr:hypothetical protein NQ317_009696 [Molorchus minor]